MKKILLVIPSLLQGGGQKFVLDLAKGLDKKKYDVKILLYYQQVSEVFKNDVQELNKSNIEIIKLNKKVGLDLSFFKKVKKVVNEYKPDIIHTHLDVLLYLLPAFKRKQIKIHTVHTVATKEASGLQRIVRRIAFKLFKVEPVAISDTCATSIKNLYRIKNVPVVYNGVVCENYQGKKKEHVGIKLIAVGTLYEVKNYTYLIDCFNELGKKVENVSLVILGDGPLKENLQKQVKDLGIVDKVQFVGAVSNVKNYLLSADIFVSSSHYEGLPLSMLEAMASGLPIVANDVGGIKDILIDGFNGYLVPYGDKEKYVTALEKLVLNNEERVRFGENAKEFVKNFDESKTVEKYENLYQGK